MAAKTQARLALAAITSIILFLCSSEYFRMVPSRPVLNLYARSGSRSVVQSVRRGFLAEGPRSMIFGSNRLGRIVQGFAAKRGPKKKEVEGPQLTPEEAEAFIAEQEGINNERTFPEFDAFEDLYSYLTPQEKGWIKGPEDFWDPGIYKIPEEVEWDFAFNVKPECDNEDWEYVRGRIRGNETHPRLWWEDIGFICIINMMAEEFDPRPWNEQYTEKEDLGWQKGRGWLCVKDSLNTTGDSVRLVGFESIRDAKRVREIINRDLPNRMRQPFIEYVSPEEFMKQAVENVNGAVTVVQAPLYLVYGSRDLKEISAQILKHPKDRVTMTKSETDYITGFDPWSLVPDPEEEIRRVKAQYQLEIDTRDGVEKGMQDILDDSRQTGGM
ncbi:hypothetical protein AAMO2058_001384300 [Amorphochlora amoebiformis]